MATVEEIIVRYSAQDNLSAQTRRIRGEVDALRASLERLGKTSVDPKVQLTGLAGASGQVSQALQRQTVAQGNASQSMAGLTRATSNYSSALTETVRQGYRFTNWVGTEVVRAGKDGAEALGVLGVAAAAAGLKAAGSFEMAQKAISVLSGSTSTGTSLMNWSVNENLRTVFTQADIQRSLQTELALGIKPTAATPILQSAENLTAATGDLGQLPEVVMALSKVTAGGHMTGREFNQLAAHGVPIAQIIAENTGSTSGAVVQAAHEGTLNVTAADFQSWLAHNSGATLGRIGANGGLAHQMNETLLGQVSTTKDAALQALRGGMQPMLPQMTRGIEQFSNVLQPLLKGEGPILGDIVLKLEHFLTTALPAVWPIVDSFFKGLDHLLSANFNGSALDKFGGDTGRAITDVFNSLHNAGPQLADDFLKFAGVLPQVADDLAKMAPVLTQLANIVADLSSSSVGKNLLAVSAVGALGVHAANSATGGMAGNVMQYMMLRQMMAGGGTAAGGAAMARAGGAAKYGGAALLGLGGAYGLYDSLSGQGASWGGALGAAGSGAALGATLGVLGGPFAGITAPVGAAGGALLGAGAYGIKALMGGGHHHTDNSVSMQVMPGAFQGMSAQDQAAYEAFMRSYLADLQRRQGGGS